MTGNNRNLKFAGAFLFLLAFFAAHTYADVWADMFGSTGTTNILQGSRHNPYSTIKPPFALQWSRTGLKENLTWGSLRGGSPAVADGIVYLCGGNGVSDMDALYAWDTNTGVPISGFPVVTPDLYNTPTLANGNVYASYVGTVYSYNASNGSYRPGFPVYAGVISQSQSVPVVVNGKVYFSGNGNVNAWDELTGAIIPGFPVLPNPNNYQEITPIIWNNTVYAMAPGSVIHAFNAQNGSVAASFITPYLPQFTSQPVMKDGVLYYMGGSLSYSLFAVDLNTGSSMPGFPAAIGSGGFYGMPAVADGVVYAATVSKLHAFYTANGGVVPGFPVSISATSSPSVANGYIYIGDIYNAIKAINASTGQEEWSYTLPNNNSYTSSCGFCGSSPAIAEDKLFVSSTRADGIFVFSMASPTQTPAQTPQASPSATVTATPQGTPAASATSTPTEFFYNSGEIYPYPNPYSTENGLLKFQGLPKDAVFTLYNLAGELIIHLRAQEGLNCWDGKNSSGSRVSPGVYTYVITAKKEKRTVIGKLCVIK